MSFILYTADRKLCHCFNSRVGRVFVSVDASVDASINASIKKYRALFFRAAIKVMIRKVLMRKFLMSKYRYAA